MSILRTGLTPTYFLLPPLSGRWVRADPAAVFAFADDDLFVIVFEAAVPAFFPVTSFLAIVSSWFVVA
jgi:hypothetical protein